MFAMSRQKKILTITIMCTALVQMCFFALTPAIAKIKNEVFPHLSLSQIQTVLMAPSLISMGFSMLSAVLIGKNKISKKSVVVIGLSLLVLSGVLSLIFHTQFWHLIMLCALVGMGAGMFIPAISSIMFDNFNEDERRTLTGYQTSFINLGGILLSAVSGFLITLVWYGGFVSMLIALPVLILAAVAIPNDKKAGAPARSAVAAAVKKTGMPRDVYYYAGLAGLFLFFYIVCSSNISTHIDDAKIGNSATAGLVTAITMGGGVFSGLFFHKLSSKLGDYLISLAYIVLFLGFTILNVGHHSLLMVMLGAFVVGTSMSMITPQCLFAVSNIVDPSNSASATSLIVSIAPGIGGFLSPIIITNLTTLLGGESTNFRFQFAGFMALAVGLIVLAVTSRRQKLKEDGAVYAKLAATKE
jgi:MFS family permease